MVKDILKAMGETAKDVFEQLPIHDVETKIQRKQEKIRLLQEQENHIYANIGRHVYRQYGSTRYPRHSEKIKKLYEARRVIEWEVQELRQENTTINEEDECLHCGKQNAKKPIYQFNQDTSTQKVCPLCDNDNPAQSQYCGHCGMCLEPK